MCLIGAPERGGLHLQRGNLYVDSLEIIVGFEVPFPATIVTYVGGKGLLANVTVAEVGPRQIVVALAQLIVVVGGP